MIKTLVVLAISPLLCAQISTPRRVQATATSSLSIKPDQARITLGVVTTAATATDAASQNAALTNKVISAATSLVGSKGSIKTVSYSIRPDYRTSQGQPSQIVSYTATNSIEVTSNDLSLLGPLIDAASQAGANSIGSPQFTLQDPEPVRQQVLAAAARLAKAHTDAMAAGVSLRTGNIVTLAEGSSYMPILSGGLTATANTTPIQPGTLEISATVTIEVELQ